jgi:TolB protein
MDQSHVRLNFKMKYSLTGQKGGTNRAPIWLVLGWCSGLMVSTIFAQQTVGIFEQQEDVGRVKIPGSANYLAEEQEYSIEGSGSNMWFDHDEFHLVWKKMNGNFILHARGEFVGTGVNAHRKMGWIIRPSLDSNAAYVDLAVHGDGLTSLQFRRTPGANTEELRSIISGPDIIQLQRKGTTYTMSVARYGDPLVNTQLSDLNLGDTVYVGLFVCSHDENVIERALFRNVRIIIPARDNFVPYQDYLGSNLEILDIETGIRKVIYRSPVSLQAPNWTPDGKALIYNSNGLLYRFDLDRNEALVINTDFAIKNNNDHVISYDGSMLGISHHDQNHDNQSIIYTLPVQGGIPRQITSTGPSYLHDWSPDGKFLIYTAERHGDYDIYKISIKGGKEIQLTNTKGLDDGSQFTPDGQFIYFNSVRSGSMQIWRMKPDGSEQEQVTDDAYNNWFPHVSPDGKWIVFLSYSPDVNPGDHPFYQQVYLRLMPRTGGTPKIIAYVYGGQGTINVSSWSPDSKKVAFVSNTD